MLLEAEDKPVNRQIKFPGLKEETDNKKYINKIQYFSFFARTSK